MASPVGHTGHEASRRLVLLPVEPAQSPHGQVAAELGADETWQLADPWDDLEASATAITRRVGDLVVLVRVDVAPHAPSEAPRCLVQQLVATLRRTSASVITSSIADEPVRRELLAVGFVPLPTETVTVAKNAGAPDVLLILQL